MKKILIISNEALSETTSNGRTMRNLLIEIPKEDIAQFYLHGAPDGKICSRYFCVSDRTALDAFLCNKQREISIKSEAIKTGVLKAQHPRPARSYRNLVLRNLVWQSMRWWTKEFTNFLKEFSPEIVLLQAGDAPFMFKIARRIANKFHAKLVMFNTEHYVLKKVMYAGSNQNMFWHNILMASLKRQYGKFMQRADYCIYNTQALEQAYQTVYPHPGKSSVLYTTSIMQPLPEERSDTFTLLYCGNLGAGRCPVIRELAEVLYKVDQNARLDIFGKFPDKKAEEDFWAMPNVCYHGFVAYEDLIPRMSMAAMLIHCENQSRVENLKYAFSTKIADSLASGRPFLVYASKDYPFVQYLEENRCAHIAENPEQLERVLKCCMESQEYRMQYCENAVMTAARFHSREENCRIFENIIESI